MECLTPSASFDIFMDNYFISFRLLTHLGVNNIRTTRVLNKNRLRKCTIIGDKQLQKRNVATLNSAHQAKKQCNFDTGWLERQQCDLHSAISKSCEPKRFVWCWNKVETIITTKSVPLLQPGHGLFQQNGPERGQVLVSE